MGAEVVGKILLALRSQSGPKDGDLWSPCNEALTSFQIWGINTTTPSVLFICKITRNVSTGIQKEVHLGGSSQLGGWRLGGGLLVLAPVLISWMRDRALPGPTGSVLPGESA